MLVLFCGLWLYPYDYRTEDFLMVPGFLAVIFILFFIRNKYLSLFLVLAAATALCVFSTVFFVCFVPSLAWIILYKTARFDNTDIAPGHDGLFFALILGYVVLCVAAFSVGFGRGIQTFEFHPRYVFFVLLALFFAVVPFLSKKTADNRKNKKKTGHSRRKLQIVSFFGLLCIPCVAVYCMRLNDYIRLYLLTLFVCFCVPLLTEDIRFRFEE